MSEKKTYAIIGASNNPEKYGYKIVEFLEERDYIVVPINPKEKSILHLPTYKSILDYPNKIDAVVFVVKPDVVLATLPQVIKTNVKEVWFQPGSESDQVIEFCKGKSFVPQFSCVMESIKIAESVAPEKKVEKIHDSVHHHNEFKSHQKKRPVVAILIRIEKDGYDLLLQRNKEPYRGYWGLIGGKLELGETIAKAAVREVQEETGLETNFNKIHAVLHEQVVDEETGEYKHSLLLIYCSVVCNDSVSITEPLVDLGEGSIQWFKTGEIPQEKTITSDYHMIMNLSDKECPFYEINQNDYRGTLGTMDIQKY